MDDKDKLVSIIATTLRDYRIDNRNTGDGTTRDQIYEPNEHTVPWAEAILAALEKRGYAIVPKAPK